MIRHLWKLTWNRRRAGALLVLEIFASFLVVFVVGTLAVYFGRNWRRPLGFEYRNVWSVSIDTKRVGDQPTAGERERLVRLLGELEALRQVEKAAGVLGPPFVSGGWVDGADRDGRYIETEVLLGTQGLDRVLGIEVERGRWFTAADETAAWRPVVINRRLAQALYGDADPLGRLLDETAEATSRKRVIGVVSDFRKQGELAGPGNFRFELASQGDEQGFPLDNVLVRLAPGTPARFEAELAARLARLAPGWSFEVTPLSRLRETHLRTRLAPLLAFGLVAFFLLLMVGLGLVGVLWQNLLRRTRELGLRRAVGASRGAVERQVVGEQLALATVGVALGFLLVIQIPLFGLFEVLPRGDWLRGAAVAAIVIYALTALAAWYPSLAAGRVEPAEALRTE